MKPGQYGPIRAATGAELVSAEPAAGAHRIGIIASRYHTDIVQGLVDAVYAELAARGVAAARTSLVAVPGAFELPLAAKLLAERGRCAVLIVLGCVIHGETPHFHFICAEAARGVTLASLETGVPIVFGVLTCNDHDQAQARISKGREYAAAALELAGVAEQLRGG